MVKLQLASPDLLSFLAKNGFRFGMVKLQLQPRLNAMLGIFNVSALAW